MSSFGSLLKHWRAARGMSQLDLSLHAAVSQRHLSAIETGKSVPSAQLVRHLGEVLGIPLRERNVLLVAAGHAPGYHETPLENLGVIGQTLDELLAAHEPNMALALDRHWNVVRANPASARFLLAVFDEPPTWAMPQLNLMRLSLHPEGLRNHMIEWEVSAAALVRRLEREVATRPNDDALEALLVEVSDYPDVADLPRGIEASAGDLLIPTIYKVDGREIHLFSTIATIGDAHDVTLEELRIETFFPRDLVSAHNWRHIVGLHEDTLDPG